VWPSYSALAQALTLRTLGAHLTFYPNYHWMLRRASAIGLDNGRCTRSPMNFSTFEPGKPRSCVHSKLRKDLLYGIRQYYGIGQYPAAHYTLGLQSKPALVNHRRHVRQKQHTLTFRVQNGPWLPELSPPSPRCGIWQLQVRSRSTVGVSTGEVVSGNRRP